MGERVFQGAFINKIQFGGPNQAFVYAYQLSSWNNNGLFPNAGIYTSSRPGIVTRLPEIDFYYDDNMINNDDFDAFSELLLQKLFPNYENSGLSAPTINYIHVS